jgi:hypothetical protein
MQVPESSHTEFQNFLRGLGYRYSDETDHPAYQLFLVGP